MSDHPSSPPPGVPAIPEAPREDEGTRTEVSAPSEPSGTDDAHADDTAQPDTRDPAAGEHIEQAEQATQATEDALKASDPDRAGRFLTVDVYPYDLGGKPKWSTLAHASDDVNEYVGAILKATDGLHEIELKGSSFETLSAWFAFHWPRVKAAGGERYGIDWFRGAYHFLRFDQDGARQADHHLQVIKSVGGYEAGDFLPIVDVELGGPKHPNHHASAQQVIDCTSAYAARIKDLTGRRVMGYWRGATRDLHITSKMGADVMWNPSYTPRIEMHGLAPTWQLDEIGLWQYSGDGEMALEGYPRDIPGFGRPDISVYIDGDRKPTLASLRARLL